VFGYQVSRDENNDRSVSPTDGTTTATSGDKTVEAQASFEERLSAALNRNKGPIDWATVRVRRDLPPSPTFSDTPHRAAQPASESEDWPLLSKPETAKYLKLYFSHFHHRWPILHAPTFDRETVPPVLLSCVTMIGACIHGAKGSKELAWSLHTRVIDYIFPRLVRPCVGIQDQEFQLNMTSGPAFVRELHRSLVHPCSLPIIFTIHYLWILLWRMLAILSCGVSSMMFLI
jgi:hypothetical protein